VITTQNCSSIIQQGKIKERKKERKKEMSAIDLKTLEVF